MEADHPANGVLIPCLITLEQERERKLDEIDAEFKAKKREVNAKINADQKGILTDAKKVGVKKGVIRALADPQKRRRKAQEDLERANEKADEAITALEAEDQDFAKDIRKALGAMTDQNHLGPKNVLTSVTWDLSPLVVAVAKAVEAGTWKSENWSYGIANGSVNLADFHGLDSNVDPDVRKRVNEKIEAIKAGSFEVPLDTTAVQ